MVVRLLALATLAGYAYIFHPQVIQYALHQPFLFFIKVTLRLFVEHLDDTDGLFRQREIGALLVFYRVR